MSTILEITVRINAILNNDTLTLKEINDLYLSIPNFDKIQIMGKDSCLMDSIINEYETVNVEDLGPPESPADSERRMKNSPKNWESSNSHDYPQDLG